METIVARGIYKCWKVSQYSTIFSTVIKMESIEILDSCIVVHNSTPYYVNITSQFLIGKIQKSNYMEKLDAYA